MNIQFTNWQSINLQNFSNSFNGQFGGIQSRLKDVDSTLGGLSTQFIFIDDGNNNIGFGMWGGYELTVRGSGFLSSANPVATSVSLADPFKTFNLNGSINVTNNFAGFYGITGGTFSSISTVFKNPAIPASNFSYTINGNFTYSALGRIDGGTITSVTTSDNSFNLKGSLAVDANEVVTGGIINEIAYKSPTGESFAVKNASISYLTFAGLIPNDPSNIDFSPLINYLTSSSILAGNDTIIADANDNIINGFAGSDTLIGGKGNDTYNIDLIRANALATSTVALQDTVSELANPVGSTVEGIDTINLTNLTGNLGAPIDTTNITNATTLFVNAGIENFNASQTGSIKLNITGNAINNTITGNDADNILLDSTGDDILNGGAGNDTLDGGIGVDTLVGGTGNDTYLVDIIPTTTGTPPAPVVVTGAQLQDVITETSGTTNGIDTLKLRGSVVIPAATTATEIALTGALANIENLDISATGVSRLNITGNAENNILTGNAANNNLTGGFGNDILDGGLGADNLDGGDGNDTYVIDNLLDVITDSSGTDTAEIRLATGTYTLNPASAIENVTLAGVAAINATGNASNNSLTGNAAANILNGGGGTDTLTGGDGADTYIIDGNDTVIETSALATGGIDLVRSSVSYTLTSNVENLTLTNNIDLNGGTANINGAGNALNNIITGNAGNNELDGAAGNDSLLGGDGADTLTGGAGIDALTGGKGNDTYNIDLIRTSALATSTVALQDTVSELANPVGSTVEGIDTINLTNLTGNLGAPIDTTNITNATTLFVNAGIENFNASQTGSIKLNITGNAINNTITGNDADNILLDSTGDDILNGGAGNDTLDGGIGVDTLVGGTGNDTYLVDIIPTTTGTPPAPVVVTGAQLQDVITETSGTTNGIDTLKLRGSVVIPAATTATEIALTGALANIENLDISATGVSRLNITGNAENNILTGNAANNNLTGGFGNDILDGGLGADNLDGGDGNDTYVIDNLLDVITDSSGTDTAEIRLATGTYTLNPASAIENVTLAGVAAINATGNASNNSLTGNAAANILNGGGGTDTLTGGDGADTYIIDGNDTVIETSALATGGIDLVRSSVSYTLTSNVENLTLTNNIDLNGGTANINGAGNALNNIITGNAGNNELDGAAGNDSLLGGDGADTLTGGAGIDALTGGKGNDTYNIDLIRTSALATSTVALQDTVSELANPVGSTVEGIDTINLTNLTGNLGAPIDTTNITNATTLFVNAGIENFNASQTGSIKLNITGNAINNTITGNDADNILLDSTGDDILNGGAGNDTLDGGIGVDTLVGGTGNDTYLVDIIPTTTGTPPAPVVVTGAQLQDVITETSGTTNGIDTLKLRGSVVIPAATTATEIALTGALANIENLDISATGVSRLNITGNAENNILTGNAANNNLTGGFGNDILDGGLGADNLDGGDGNDTYVIDNLLDVITDSSGTDTAEIRLATGTYTLNPASAIENVTLAGVAAINATGNASNNSLTGNAAANILNGGGGTDTLTGGDGADTYIIDGNDTVIETSALATGGIDLVRSSVSYTLTSNVENLTLTNNIDLNGGTANINGAGNALNNIITGNAGNNELDGAAGNDSLLGGDGADTLTGGAGIDALTGGKGNDTYNIDLIRTSALATSTVALQDTVSELANPVGSTVEGIDTINLTNLTGNLGAPIDTTNITNATTLFVNAGIENFNASQTGSIKLNITGNAINNTITGNDADNILLDSTGDDILNGGAGNDTLDGGIGVDTLVGGTGNDTYLVDIIPTTTGTPPAPVVVTGAQLQDVITETSGTTNGIDTLKLRGSVVIPAATTATEIALTGALANIENLDISATGVSRLNITGNAENNILTGNAANNNLTGGFGNDILDGGLGADNLDGGDGNDTYVIDNLLDVITDSSGTDTAEIRLATGTYTLNPASAIENVTLAGVAAINATGNASNNSLTGNAAANILNGGGGTDTLTGGDGADTYIIDGNDTVIETSALATGGIDLVRSSVSYTLTSNVENLTLTNNIDLNGGTANINGAGNALNNIITGNAGNNELDGAAGNDSLLGGDGADTLTGGAGIDALTGGKGNDTYNIDLIRTSALATSTVALQDTVSELANPVGSTVEGIDTINLTNLTGNLGAPIDTTNITNATTLFVNAGIENFNASQTGSIKLNITGNTLANTITGNDADNILLDSTGDDILNGGAGNDTLDGGIGVDTLVGGTGNDTYLVDIIPTTTGTPPAPVVVTGAQLQDVITETSGTTNGIDTLKLRGSVVIPAATTATEIALTGALANIENLDISLTGTTRLNITGNAENNILTGNAANNIINGGAGVDSMSGGLGDDTYYIDNELDSVVETVSAGVDTLNYVYQGAPVAYFLGANIENLTLGAGVQGGFEGNILNNYIIGNDASTITGREGNDTLVGASQMFGGAGDDLYIINGAGQTANETSSLEGFDRVEASVDVDLLGQYIENLTLLGGAIIGNGNDIANTITGNSNNNILDGFSGNDTIFGGLGDDTLIGSLGNDILNGGAGQDFYVFNTDLEATNNKDTIQGFNVLEDLILLDYTKFNAIGSYLEESEFRSGAGVTTASTANQHIIFNTSTGALYYDEDGVGGTAAIQFASLTNTLGALNSFSFLLGINFSQIGTDQADTLNGTSGDDAINGLAGNDIINGGAGADIMFGDLGDDTFYVDNVNDVVLEDFFYFNEINGYFDENGYTNTIYSSVSFTADFGIGNLTLTGSDNINGFGSNYKSNIITGNSGDNILDGGIKTNPELDNLVTAGTHIFLGNLDTLIGGAGNDTYIIRNAETVIENANEGIDTYILSAGGGVFLIDPSSEIENFILANDNVLIDYLSGTNKDNLIVANNIANNIYGLAGNDELKGMGGDDKLYGMTGNDILWGGTGSDTFVFESAGTVTYDIVKDFVSGQDKIRVSDGIFFKPALLSGIYTDMFFTGTAAQDGNDYFIYNKFTGDLYFDEDGFGANTQQLIANFLPNTVLLQSDFVGALNTTQPIIIVLTDQLITGSAFNDSLAGGAGNDTINAGAGNDTLNGGDGNDKLNGEADNDTLFGMGGDDTLNGGSGNDILNGGDGNDTVNGNEGNDVIISIEGIRPITPFANFNVGLDRMDGGEGSDIYSIINGGGAFDYITDTGITGTDEIRYSITPGGDAAINLSASGVEKVVLGTGTGATADTTGTEQLTIFAFDMTYGLTLEGNDGNNQINGTNFDDIIYGRMGNDRLIGGAGNDTLIFNDDSSVNVSLVFSRATGDGTDIISEFENIIGTSFNDFLEGDFIENIIKGGGGNDFILGGAGNDTLEGGSGNDTIYGDNGNDLITGGIGNDIFGFNELLTFPQQNFNTLTDFTSGSDKIFLHDYIFTSLAYGIYSDMFISSNGTVVAQDANDFLLYNKNTGDFFYDADASGSGSAILIAKLLPGTTLLASDFIHYSPIAEPTITGLKILGTPGGESLSGTANDDTINGLQGNDTISAGAGNDTIRGGENNDSLTGGLGSDVFTWQLTDQSFGINPAVNATDTITDFSLIQNDKLDLRDLLDGESSANLLNYLDVTTSTDAGATNTEIRISNTGGFAGGNFSATAENAHITLAGVNLLTGTNETDLLATLIAQNKLIIDM